MRIGGRLTRSVCRNRSRELYSYTRLSVPWSPGPIQLRFPSRILDLWTTQGKPNPHWSSMHGVEDGLGMRTKLALYLPHCTWWCSAATINVTSLPMRIEQGNYHGYCVCVWPYPRCGSDHLITVYTKHNYIVKLERWAKCYE